MKQFISILILTFICLIVGGINGDIWNSCGTASDKFQIGSVAITPDPPVKGQPFTISANGELIESVTSGNAHLLVKFGMITIINKNENICGSESPVTCPVSAGSYNHTVTITIPNNAPSGEYKANAVLTDQTNQEIACINVDLRLK